MSRDLTSFILGVVLIALASGVMRWPIVERLHADHYLGGAALKLQLLEESEAGISRVVLFGGSGTAFSIDSGRLEHSLDRMVANLGLHAGVAPDRLWRVYEGALTPGSDVVLVSIEYDVLTDEQPAQREMFCRMLYVTGTERFPDDLDCAAFFIRYVAKDTLGRALGFANDDGEPEFYARSGFDPLTGDFVAHIGRLGKQPLNGIQHVRRSIGDALRGEAEEAGQIGFIRDLRARGFATYFLPVVVADSACDGRAESLAALNERIASSLHQPSTSGLSPCLPDEMFFDSVYHGGPEARAVRTAEVADYALSLLGGARREASSHP